MIGFGSPAGTGCDCEVIVVMCSPLFGFAVMIDTATEASPNAARRSPRDQANGPESAVLCSETPQDAYFMITSPWMIGNARHDRAVEQCSSVTPGRDGRKR